MIRYTMFSLLIDKHDTREQVDTDDAANCETGAKLYYSHYVIGSTPRAHNM